MFEFYCYFCSRNNFNNKMIITRDVITKLEVWKNETEAYEEK